MRYDDIRRKIVERGAETMRSRKFNEAVVLEKELKA